MSSLPRLGLIVLGLLALGDLAAPLLTDGDHPPLWVAFVSVALGLASLACLPGAWRGHRRPLLGLLTARLLSALLAAPAFFVDEAPPEVIPVVGLVVALTVVGVLLALAGNRRPVTP